MLGYTVGIPEKGSTYGTAGRNEQFWRCDIYSSSMFQLARLCSSFATATHRNNGGGVFGVLIMMVAEVAVVLVRMLMLVVGEVFC